MPVVGPASLQDSEPRLLQQIVNSISSPQQGDEITNEPVLVLLDQRLEDSGISLVQPKRDSLRIAFHGRPRSQLIIEHTTGIRNMDPKLRKLKPVPLGNRKLASGASITFSGKSVEKYPLWTPVKRKEKPRQGRENLNDSYADLLDAAEGADLMLAGELMYAAPLVADKLSLPWASIILSPCSFLSAHDQPREPLSI